ncbi:MAG: aspartate/glutamate racemase family protein, partial [Planctomycetes bacterium]|nr:aspartate/glutamate racemase family protein [Planctomycetota bacterium]
MTSLANPELGGGVPVGVFDSGIGGLSVLRELLKALPRGRFLYYADRAHMPYGERPLAEVAGFSRAITRFFLARGARMVVVACNTASAAALRLLRQEFPGVPFVGMEPAVKPAAERTRSGHVGVLATAGTLRGSPYAWVVRRFAQG